jgi:flagellar biosynthesis protein FlhA
VGGILLLGWIESDIDRFLVVGDSVYRAPGTNEPVGDSSYREELEKLARALGVRRQVIFTGLRLDVPALLADVTISVLPTLTEALSNTILESMADASGIWKDPDIIIETVRAALGRSVCRPYQAENGDLRVIALSPALEDTLAASVTRTDRGAVLALDPERAQRLAGRLGEVLAHEELAQPVLLCTPTLRPHLWRLFSRALPHIAVLSHSEVPAQMRVMAVATLE